jgi:tRNA threonylcarbamoyladenosine biosynthesis protein TsaE
MIFNLDKFITTNSKHTRKMGEIMAQELKGGEIICLSGDLGSGKTTFAQGVLRGLKAKGRYTSPTFVIMKYYKKKSPISKSKFPNKSQITKPKIQNIYHIDAYRVGAKDILELGWEEIIAGENNIVIVEWAERIKKIIPKKAVWMKFGHLGKDRRKIVLNHKSKITNSK